MTMTTASLSLFSPPKMFITSIAVASSLSARLFLHQASAFVDLSWRTTQTAPQSRQRAPATTSTLAQSLSPFQTDSISAAGPPGDQVDENFAHKIPTTGYSLADQLENEDPKNRERFETTLTPVDVKAGLCESEKKLEFEYDDDGFPTGYREVTGEEDEDEGESSKNKPRHEGVARIDTRSTFGKPGQEPVRWLVSLREIDDDDGGSYAMIDLPPYSDKLARDMRSFMEPATLDVVLLTSRQCVHYDEAPAVYVTRQSDLLRWKAAFPRARVVMYRLDVPREFRGEVQALDGYGPWGWEEEEEEAPAGGRGDGDGDGDGNGANADAPPGPKFVETGRPLRVDEWDEDIKSRVRTRGELPLDEGTVEDYDDEARDDQDDAAYSPKAIRAREDKYRLLAIYTPGHTFGSVTYVFPRRGICCSGYALPIESAGADLPDQGPRLDYRGYLATSASRSRQMSSALDLIDGYIDRFQVVLPARGDFVFLQPEKETRKRELLESVGLYQKINDIYGRLGIVE